VLGLSSQGVGVSHMRLAMAPGSRHLARGLPNLGQRNMGRERYAPTQVAWEWQDADPSCLGQTRAPDFKPQAANT